MTTSIQNIHSKSPVPQIAESSERLEKVKFTGTSDGLEKVKKIYKKFSKLDVFCNEVDSWSSKTLLENYKPGTYLFRSSNFGKKPEGIYFSVDVTGKNHVRQHRFLISSNDAKIYNVSDFRSRDRRNPRVVLLRLDAMDMPGIEPNAFFDHVYFKLGGRSCYCMNPSSVIKVQQYPFRISNKLIPVSKGVLQMEGTEIFLSGPVKPKQKSNT